LNVADQEIAAAHMKSSPMENILREKQRGVSPDLETPIDHSPDSQSTTKAGIDAAPSGVLEAATSIKLKPMPLERIQTPPPYWPKYFALDIERDSILIESIQVTTSDPEIPYRIRLFAMRPSEDTMDWEKEDLIGMKNKAQRVITFLPAKSLPYTDIDRQQQMHCAIEPLRRPIRVDLDYEDQREELIEYYQAPVTYQITLRYTLPR
jgi:hypothetical protein